MSSDFHSLFRVFKHGTEADRIASDIEHGQGVAAGGHVYWAEKGRIRRALCDGTLPVTVAELPGAAMGDIALGADHVYFTTRAFGDRLMRVCR